MAKKTATLFTAPSGKQYKRNQLITRTLAGIITAKSYKVEGDLVTELSTLEIAAENYADVLRDIEKSGGMLQIISTDEHLYAYPIPEIEEEGSPWIELTPHAKKIPDGITATITTGYIVKVFNFSRNEWVHEFFSPGKTKPSKQLIRQEYEETTGEKLPEVFGMTFSPVRKIYSISKLDLKRYGMILDADSDSAVSTN